MQRISFIFTLCFVFTLGWSLTTQAQSSTAIRQARPLIVAFQQSQQIPGVAVTVMQKGEIIWSEGFGYADLEHQVPVYPDRTKFRIGSISKPMTAAMIGLLYEQGKLDPDVPIQQYVPDFPKKSHPVTTRQLAGHLAGIRHYKGLEFMSSKHYPTVASGLVIFQDDPLLHAPGSKYQYSSYGWNLISAVLEGASGEEFLPYMQKNVFDALGLKHTCADQVTAIIPNRTRYYDIDLAKQVVHAPFVDNSYKWAGGGFISSAEDVAKFAHAHIHPGFLAQKTLDMLLVSQKTNDGKLTNYGMGWRSGTNAAGHKWFGHSGGSVGGTSQMVVFPEKELVVVMLTNSSSVSYNGLHMEVASLFLGE